MSETEEVTVLIDLDRMPKNIGHIRQNDNRKGVYNHRIYTPDSYQDIINWVSKQIGTVQDARIVIQGSLPNTLMMGIAIDLKDDIRVCSILHSKFGDIPTEVWNVYDGGVVL